MKYLSITYPDIENGPGCRVTLWIPGCGHKCPGCHTPWTHDYNAGSDFTQDEFDKICEMLDKDYISGLTISGGDPLMQPDDVLIDLLQLVHDIKEKYPYKDIWLYTGYTYEQLKDIQLEVLDYIDVLVDGPFNVDLKDTTIPFRGSTNQRIIDIKNYHSYCNIITLK